MKNQRIDPSWSETGWFRNYEVMPERQDYREVRPVVPVRSRRQRVVKAIGVLFLAGVAGFAGWMAGTTSARYRIADWGTLGNASQPTLNEGTPIASELAEQQVRLSDAGAEPPTFVWAMEPALAIPDPAREPEVVAVGSYYPPSALDPQPSNQDDYDELVRQATDL